MLKRLRMTDDETDVAPFDAPPRSRRAAPIGEANDTPFDNQAPARRSPRAKREYGQVATRHIQL